MTARVAILLVIALVVAVAAWRLRRAPADAPIRDVHPVPRQLRRDDFPRPDAPWLVVLFSATTCDSCRGLWEKVAVLSSPEVATCEIEQTAHGDLHRRYDLQAVPTTLVADADGVVRRSFVGAFSATDLWSAVAEARDPGTTPEPGIGAFGD